MFLPFLIPSPMITEAITQSTIPIIPTILNIREDGPNKTNARNNEEKIIEHLSHLFKLLSIFV